MDPEFSFPVPATSDGQTLAAIVRQTIGELSWSDARRIIAARRVRVNGNVTVDDARRLKAGEIVEISEKPQSVVPRHQHVVIRYSDADLIVVEKPPGIQSVRRPEERGWDAARKAKQPTLDELIAGMLEPPTDEAASRKAWNSKPRGGRTKADQRVRAVHRLDQDTSGLMIFTLSATAQMRLSEMFAAHKVRRVYTAVVHGSLDEARTIDTWLVRDRGDGVRGTTSDGSGNADAKRAITHVQPVEQLNDAYTIIECRLETGRTHQIRIHLAELGHRLCGEKIYTRRAIGAAPQVDFSGAPRHALHSHELEFQHPVTSAKLNFSSPIPRDLADWLIALRGRLGIGS